MKIKRLALLMALLMILSSCGRTSRDEVDTGDFTKFDYTFFDTFDTIITYMAYEEDEAKFKEDADFVESEFQRLHKIFDNYNTYQGVNNVKSINDTAGQGPVEVDPELIECLNYAIDWNGKISDKVNVAMGPVLGVWHTYREAGMEDPNNAKTPGQQELEQADGFTDISKVKVNTRRNTVEIEEGMNLDLGGIAKGYAVEYIADKLEKERGIDSACISAGGNVKAIGSPKDERARWGIGIANPDHAKGRGDDQVKEVLYIKDLSVVTSGDYQRFYTVNNRDYHHIIDPDTLMPPDHYTSVSIITEDSALADFLSTAAFLLPFEESKALVEKQKNTDAIWIDLEGNVQATDGALDLMQSQGASSTE